MEWRKLETSPIWYKSQNTRTAVIHYNEYTRCYDVSVAILFGYDGGTSISAQGFRTLEEAQEWVRLMV